MSECSAKAVELGVQSVQMHILFLGPPCRKTMIYPIKLDFLNIYYLPTSYILEYKFLMYILIAPDVSSIQNTLAFHFDDTLCLSSLMAIIIFAINFSLFHYIVIFQETIKAFFNTTFWVFWETKYVTYYIDKIFKNPWLHLNCRISLMRTL